MIRNLNNENGIMKRKKNLQTKLIVETYLQQTEKGM